ncbi:hypothetical protein AX774_g6429 [Zancudomyces culisetae]|uniref:Uncharacterized protein n=1 Tax=Zancudomyces culisetae TaxID=1213189 RepID=A0A1R1PGR8_ZANCU|nr:hypothetical protein AX774_g6429 [Zancudomyces culisetae]|eukprot:OMH80138.1 hypothetical protein AX774_g6429 [Zancudomyces culisetae]
MLISILETDKARSKLLIAFENFFVHSFKTISSGLFSEYSLESGVLRICHQPGQHIFVWLKIAVYRFSYKPVNVTIGELAFVCFKSARKD